ncbi:Glycine--tRNA ligase, chloroplastic/mitochondrial 2, partial [Mucuna pruriens]
IMYPKHVLLYLCMMLCNIFYDICSDPENGQVDKGVSAEFVRSILVERANFPCLAAKSAYKIEELSRGNLFPKVVEAYSRPTRIVRGKEDEFHMEVDEAAFVTNEERVLWSTFLSVKKSINPGLDIDDFVEISCQLIQPLEDFFNNVFVMVLN